MTLPPHEGGTQPMTFAVGSTIEQRYPGAAAELARASARDRVQAFQAAGWEIREERWMPDSVAASGPGAGPQPPFSAPGSGTLVVVFAAAREASLPTSLHTESLQAAAGPQMSRYVLRLVLWLVIFAIVLAILVSVGVPIVSRLVAG
jgi:hypothetical protein